MGRSIVLDDAGALSVEYVDAVAARFHKSGYFGDLTEAQIVTLIFVGDALGLTPANAVFDLEIKDCRVRYKVPQSFQAAADAVEHVKVSLQLATGEKAMVPTLEAPDATPDPASAAGEIVPFSPAPSIDSQKSNTAPAHIQKTDYSANKAALLTADAERPGSKAEAGKIEARPESSQTAAVLSDTGVDQVHETITIINRVVEALAKDGKRTRSEQAGFFLYADVPLDPAEWTIDQAKQAEARLKPFLERNAKKKR